MAMAMEEENNGNWPQEHPLLNSVVLKQVFDYLKPSACNLDVLKNIRQVCKVWRDESLGWWRETAVLQLTPEMIEDPELTTITQLLEGKPFQKFKLKNVTINIPDCFEEGTQQNRFWNTVGPHVKHLILTGAGFRFSGFLKPLDKPVQAFMQFLIEKLPNLSTLDIKDTFLGQGYKPIVVTGNDRMSILGLQHSSVVSIKFDALMARIFALKNFPNLRHLVLESLEVFYEMLRHEQLSLNEPVVHSTLKDLELILQEDTSLMNDVAPPDFLSQVNFPVLERLSVDFRDGRHNSSSMFLPVFLSNNFEKLKVLEVSYRPYVRPYSHFLYNCPLDELRELRLWGNVVKDLSFLMWTPKLKVLHMDPYGLEKKNAHESMERGKRRNMRHIVEATMNKEGMKWVVLHDLEYLQINSGLFPLQGLETLGEWMPNLKTLRTVLGFGSTALICDQWPLLEHLVGMHGSYLSDKDIIGNSEEKGLLDLAELKSFHLSAACDGGRLTDLAVHSGFLKMNKLTDLQICVSDKFSLEAEKRLKDRILNVAIIRNYAGNEKHVNWECCKNRNCMGQLDRVGWDESDSDTTTESESENEEINNEDGDEGEDEDETESDEEAEEETSDDEEEEKSQKEDTEEGKKGSDAQGSMGEVD